MVNSSYMWYNSTILYTREDYIMASCPKCGSENVSFQREQTASFGGSLHSFKNSNKGHGCLWWICIGSWWWVVKFMWEMMKICCTCGLSLFFRGKKTNATKGKTVTATKTINRTVAVCQECGHSWKV